MSAALGLYRWATRLAEPLAQRLLQGRARRGKEDPARMAERLGQASFPRPPGPLIWLHGVSVGESLSLLPLVAALHERRPDLALLVTSGTTTSAELLGQRLPPGVLHQYAPIDSPAATARFFDHWRPSVGVVVESELWPNLILGAEAHGVRMALVSARMTQKSADQWRVLHKASSQLLGAFDLILAQDQDSADRFEALGAKVAGRCNLKLPADPLPYDPATLDELAILVRGRRLVVAASTHPGEDEFIASCAPADALVIVAPRHPDRGPALAAKLSGLGRKVGLRSAGDQPSAQIDTYVADTLGELGLFFRLDGLVVLGGSYIDRIGGHNPLEPARLGRAALHGPYIANWEAVYADLGEGAVLCGTRQALTAQLARLLADPGEAARLGEIARLSADGHDRVVEDLILRLSDLLPA